jgi:hypothetical protein
MGVPGGGVGNNDAFDPNPIPEVVRIARDIAKWMDGVGDACDLDHYLTTCDVNCNEVGRFKLG